MEHGSSGLAPTYANDRFQDGAGAQLQRIYGIYALSRFLRVPYVHSPLAHLGYHGLLALENNGPLADPVREYNRLFHIPSDLALPEQPVIHEMQDPHIGEIARIRDAANRDGRFHLVRIVCPYTVMDRYPEAYRCLKVISPFTHNRSGVFRLAIHVRRGDLFVVDGDRMLPNSYYVSHALRFQALLTELDIPFVCELYTEVPIGKFEVTPQHHGIDGRIARSITVDPAMNHLEDFDGIPRLERFINADAIESLRRMATADALILSRSSFSYLAALLSPNGIAVYHNFWHSPLKDWLVSGEHGLPEKSLFERLKEWKRAAGIGSALGSAPGSAPGDSVHGPGPRRGAKASLADFVAERRETIAGIAAGHGATHVRVIGSVAYGAARFDDEIGLLALWPEGNGRLNPAALAAELEIALGRKVGIAVHDGSEAGGVTAFYRDIVCPRILRTEPFGGTDDATCEVHAQVGCGDWLDVIWSLKSFYRFSSRRYALCLHDDGTVPEHGLEQLRRHFPNARVIGRREADARARFDLRDFPRCIEFRGRHAMGPRIFDFPAFLQSERMLWFDSGLLFFAEPTELLGRIENAEYRRNAFQAACDHSDGAPAALPPFHNGLGLAQRGSLPADWCEEFLAESAATCGKDGGDEERTLLALCSYRFGADLLPDEYALHSDPGIANRPVHHYADPSSRSFRYSEGIATLIQRNFLPWRFAVLMESERLV